MSQNKDIRTLQRELVASLKLMIDATQAYTEFIDLVKLKIEGVLLEEEAQIRSIYPNEQDFAFIKELLKITITTGELLKQGCELEMNRLTRTLNIANRPNLTHADISEIITNLNTTGAGEKAKRDYLKLYEEATKYVPALFTPHPALDIPYS